MATQKRLCLLIIVLTLIIHSQVIDPIGNCFGNCASCDRQDLSLCIGTAPCQDGFVNHKGQKCCSISPAFEYIAQQLPQRKVTQPMPKTVLDWGHPIKQSTCEYSSNGSTRYIDMLGLYDKVSMLQHTYQVSQNSNVFILSFNLIRDQWRPLNDFILIDVSNGKETIQSYELAYETRITMDMQPQLLCSNKHLITDKYSLTIPNNARITTSLTIIFTSFLYTSVWGLTNIKLLQGCQSYTIFDINKGTCSMCDTDSYAVVENGGIWCEKCSEYCSKCQRRDVCLSCMDGAVLGGDNKCWFVQKYKSQAITLLGNTVTCSGITFAKGSLTASIIASPMVNQYSELYDQIQLGFKIYYNPQNWLNNTQQQITITINKAIRYTLGSKNLTSNGTTTCNIIKGNKVAYAYVLTPSIVLLDNVINIEVSLSGKNREMEFGVSDLVVKSLKKMMFTQNASVSQTAAANISQNATKVIIDETSKPKVNNSKPISNADKAQLFNKLATQPNQSNPPLVVPLVKPNVSVQIKPIFAPPTTIKPANDVPANKSSLVQIIPIKNDPVQNSSIAKNSAVSPLKQIPTLQHIKPLNTTNQQLKAFNIRQTKISYIPSSNNGKSGLQVVINNIPSISQHIYSAIINVLSPEKVSIETYGFVDNNLHIFIKIDESFFNGTLSIFRSYNNSASILLQNSQKIAEVVINRYDSFTQNQLQSISAFSTFFKISAWIGVIAIIIFVMIGYGVVIEQYIISLQVIFLHVYLVANYLPLSFRDVIGGLSIVQNLNYFIPAQSSQMQHQWLGNVIQNGPIRFQLFRTGINFSRQLYPIIIINIIYILFFTCLHLTNRFLLRQDLIQQQKTTLHRILDNITTRSINLCDTIWRYQFLTTVWCCFVQFYNLEYSGQSNRNAMVNSVVCVVSFCVTLGWPGFVNWHCWYKYYQSQYGVYLYTFEDIYYRKIPLYFLPSNHQRIGYPIIRAAKLFLTAMMIAYLGSYPAVALVFLVMANLFEIGYINYQQIYNDRHYFKFRVIQNFMIIILDLVLLVLCVISNVASSSAFVTLGYLLSSFCVILVVNSFVRVGYLAYKKYLELEGWWLEDGRQQMDDKPKTQRII